MEIESVYWAFTLRCNDRCDHCYNDSSPTGEALPIEELLRVVPNLPDAPRRVLLSGGEPTVEMAKLEAVVGALRDRYGRAMPLHLQTNGDLLDDARMARLAALPLDRVDVVSMDRYHKHQGSRRDELERRFRAAGWRAADDAPLDRVSGHVAGQVVFSFWGATEDLWLGGNWARGRALQTGTAKLDPAHNFCAMWSGALGFLDQGSARQEVHVQLANLYPCCPTTYLALGDVREEPVEAILARYRGHPDWEALNLGQPAQLGEGRVSAEHAAARIEALGDVCLWCDEYLREHYEGPRGPARSEAHRTPFDV